MKNLFLIGAFVMFCLLNACKPSGKQNTTTEVGKDTTNIALTDTMQVYNSYLAVKNDLVKTDGKSAQESAKALASKLADVAGCDESEGLANKMAATNDVKSQRILFVQLSKDIIPLIKGMKKKAAPIYVAYCPMADEGKGGYWLTAENKIMNPYYGDEMMECGEIKEVIK